MMWEAFPLRTEFDWQGIGSRTEPYKTKAHVLEVDE
jgi:hypothetical protein